MRSPTKTRFLSGAAVAAALAGAGVAVLAVPARAQVNIEKMRGPEKEAGGLSGTLKLDVSSKSGNTDLTELNAAARTDYVRGRGSVFAVVQIEYGWASGDAFSDEGLVHLRSAYTISGPVALETFAQTDYNKSRRLDARAVVGGGVRWTVAERKRARVTCGTSYMFEHEELELPEGATHESESNVNRWSSYISLSVALGKRASLSSTGYAQPRFDRFSDVRVVSESAVAVGLGAGFALAVGFRLRHDSEPPDDTERTDTTLTTGLAISF